MICAIYARFGGKDHVWLGPTSCEITEKTTCGFGKDHVSRQKKCHSEEARPLRRRGNPFSQTLRMDNTDCHGRFQRPRNDRDKGGAMQASPPTDGIYPRGAGYIELVGRGL